MLKIIPEFMRTPEEQWKIVPAQNQIIQSAQVTNSNSNVLLLADKSSVWQPKYFTNAQLTFSVAIITADILMFTFYFLIIYYNNILQ